MKHPSKVYGPYLDSTGTRRIVLVHYADGTRKTMGHARWLMQQHLGRELLDTETVDHIDGDPLNDVIDNFQLLSMADNISKSAREKELVTLTCVFCGDLFEREARNERRRLKLGRSGPYCGKTCVGKSVHVTGL